MWVVYFSYRFLAPTPCGASYRGFSAQSSPFSDVTHTTFWRKMYHDSVLILVFCGASYTDFSVWVVYCYVFFYFPAISSELHGVWHG